MKCFNQKCNDTIQIITLNLEKLKPQPSVLALGECDVILQGVFYFFCDSDIRYTPMFFVFFHSARLGEWRQLCKFKNLYYLKECQGLEEIVLSGRSSKIIFFFCVCESVGEQIFIFFFRNYRQIQKTTDNTKIVLLNPVNQSQKVVDREEISIKTASKQG